MASRDVQVRILSQFEDQGFKSAAQSAAAFERELNKVEQTERRVANMQMQAQREMAAAQERATAQRMAAINNLANTVGVLGLAMTAAAGIAVAKAAEFDAAMSNVAATGQDARNSLEQLREAAIDAGQRTVFSATEAAGAIENLAKAGVSSADILGGALTGALDLAAAGELDVAAAAEIAAIAMSQFGLSGQDVTHVADLLAAGAGKANGSVEEMGAALKQAGLVASQTGLTIEETTAALAAFAEAGLLGSDAGTSLKTMLQRLTAPSGEAARLMQELGISAYDASGQFVGLEALAGQLRGSLEGLTPAQRNAALATMFGADAVRAASVLYENGAQGIAEWTAAVNDQGYAAEAAAIRMDNLKGDLEQLRGSIETALIGIGEGSQGPLRSLVQGVTDVVNSFSQLPPAIQGGLGILVGGSGLALLAVAGVGKLIVSIHEAKAAMEALGVSSGKTGALVKGIGAAATVGAVGALASTLASMVGAAQVVTAEVSDLADELTRVADGANEAGPALSGIFTNNLADWAPWVQGVQSADEALEAFGVSAREALGGGFWDDVDRLMDMGGDMSRFESQVSQLDDALAEMVASGNGEQAAAMLERFLEAAAAQGVDVERVRGMFDGYASAMEQVGQNAEDAAGGIDAASAAMDAQEASALIAADAIQTLIDALDELNGGQLNLLDATSQWEEALDSVNAAIEENGQTTDLTTEAGRANVEVLTGMARAAADLASATLEQTGSQEQFYASLDASRAALAATAMQMGMTEAQAWAFVDSVLAVPPATNTVANLEVSQALADLEALGIKIDTTTGTVTINGNPVPAETTLGALIGNVNASDGTVTINGNRYPADLTVGGLVAWINGQSGTVTANANTGAAEAAIQWLIRPRTMTIRVAYAVNPNNPALPQADGGVVEYYAPGGIREHHTAQIAPAGAWRVWAEPETGGEAYIPLAPGKRARSLDILEDVAHRFGKRVVDAQGSAWATSTATAGQDIEGAVRAGVAAGLAGAVLMIEDRGPFANQVAARIKQAIDQGRR